MILKWCNRTFVFYVCHTKSLGVSYITLICVDTLSIFDIISKFINVIVRIQHLFGGQNNFKYCTIKWKPKNVELFWKNWVCEWPLKLLLQFCVFDMTNIWNPWISMFHNLVRFFHTVTKLSLLSMFALNFFF